ncbi:MAG: adenylate/guanylate cyclase domain-containing protein, partial [Deltaproteobacteria bacterium]|nr:adenylate/guanylate cyclase domain-containing protein [Deltaproteobacteria bacterium]
MISSVNTKKSIEKIAVLFTDIIGSTRFFQSHGNLDGRKMLRQHEDIVSKAITEFGGTVVKNIGDSILAYFADPREAAKVAIRIQKEFNRYNKQKDAEHEIHVRIGIHFDEGIVEDKDIFGNAVNIASKITNLAGSNQIFI